MSAVGETEYDPFEDFNRSAGIGVVEDPYPIFTMARATAPLVKEDVRALAGLEVEGEDQAGFVDPELFGSIPDVFTAFTYDAVQTSGISPNSSGSTKPPWSSPSTSRPAIARTSSLTSGAVARAMAKIG